MWKNAIQKYNPFNFNITPNNLIRIYIHKYAQPMLTPLAVNKTNLNTLSFGVFSIYLSVLKAFELETPQ